MGNIGTGELLVVVLLALLVFGPNRLPEMMRNFGKAWRTFQEESRKAADALRLDLDGPKTGTTGAGVVDRPDPLATPAKPPVVIAPVVMDQAPLPQPPVTHAIPPDVVPDATAPEVQAAPPPPAAPVAAAPGEDPYADAQVVRAYEDT